MRIPVILMSILLMVGGWGAWAVYRDAPTMPPNRFEVRPGETASALADRLAADGLLKHRNLFLFLAARRGLDRKIRAGAYSLTPPATLARLLDILETPDAQEEKTITIIPGWDLRDIAEYFEREGVVSAAEFYRLAGEPARLKAPGFHDVPSPLSAKPAAVSLEGYLAPNTYRIFADATGEEIIRKLVEARAGEFDAELLTLLAKSGRNAHEVLTLASIVEREVRGDEDRAMVADIFWRRLDAGWGLQADSTVHYAVGKKGDVFTTKEDRDRDSPWNTYKYAGLPPGPIGTPSISAIRAVLSPTKNPYWYFLTTLDGEARLPSPDGFRPDGGQVKYAKTIDEHHRNVARYLR